MNVGLVTKMSSPTSWTLAPRRLVSSAQPAQSSSARPSSRETIGYLSIQLSQRSISSPESRVRPSVSSRYWPVTPPTPVPSTRIELVAGSSAMRDLLAGLVAGLLDGPQDDLDGGLVRRQRRREAALVALAGRESPRRAGSPCRAWKTSAPARRASAKVGDADRHDHELLEVGGVHGVLAAVEDVEQRDRQDPRARRRRGSGRAAGRRLAATAWAQASETPRIALAPSLPLFGVPSRAISAASMPAWSAASVPEQLGRDRSRGRWRRP